MTELEWAEIERIYHDALTRPPGERAAFVAQACGGDRGLQATIESLLDYEPRARDFLERGSGDARPSPVAAALTRAGTSLTPGRFVGSALGAYVVDSLIAAGGMGEVYRARDTRLDRTVAIKILPEHFADDPDRRDRFHREARIISSLNHPHICALYDVGEDKGVQYLVMEYIEGETLDQRIRRGRVPVNEALGALIQVTDALDKAHRRGIVHRDLKPGNIMWTKAGVKLLDFGLARRSHRRTSGGELLTTGQSRTLTGEGTIMGTVQYMAPEQLHGEPTDVRTDIFAFAVVAYEMLTGKRAFQGASQAALIGAILKDEPEPIADAAPDVPGPLAQTLSRCLAKDPDERWQTASDLLFQLRSIASSPQAVSLALPAPAPRRWRLERAAWIGIAVAALGAGLAWRTRDAPPRQDTAMPLAPVVFPLSPSQGGSLSAFWTPFAVSPDGGYLAYVAAGSDGIGRLWLRSLNTPEDRQVPGTEGAGSPFWSPDSQWVGFFAASTLKKVRVNTLQTQTLATNVVTVGGAAWSGRNEIVFPGALRGIQRVSATSGGQITALIVEPGNQFSPQFLSDGVHFIYSSPGRSAIGLAHIDGGSPRTLMTLASGTTALGYSRGHVLFVQDGSLYARPFDEQRLDFTGDARRLVDGIPAGLPARTPFSVSAAGVLVYWTEPLGVPAVLRWYDRDGRPAAAVTSPTRHRGFALSPDGRRLIFARIGKTAAEDLWLRSLDDGKEEQLTFDGGSFMPVWSADGTRIAHSGFSVRPPPKAYIRDLRYGRVWLAGDSPIPTFPTSWAPDGQEIVVSRAAGREGGRSHGDLMRQVVAGGPAEPLWFNTPANEFQGKVSPDGRWIAYVTDESGISEVWIAGYPTGTFKRQVSRGGGDFPHWAATELFFLSRDRRLMTARIGASPAGVEITEPRTLFAVPDMMDIDPLTATACNPFASTKDGHRFLIAERVRDFKTSPLTVVANWQELLKR